MSLNLLICPQCNCSLAPPSGQSAGMSCPRCNTWLEIDPKCSGSCMACHKITGAQIDAKASACVELSDTSCGSNGATGGEITSNGVQRKLQGIANSTGRSLLHAWKAVFH